MPTPSNSAIASVLVALAATLPAGFAAAPPRVVPLEQRIAAERAVQDVYAAARIWPESNPTARPSRHPALTDEALRARVVDLLRKSDALSTRWGRTPSSAVLAAELRRMAEGTRAPETLRALFAALGDDPVLEAETLARRSVVERELRSAYAWDRELHAAVRARAEAAMRGVRVPSDLARFGNRYRETVVALDGSIAPDELAQLVRGLEASFGREPVATSDNAAAALSGLPVGRVSALGEDADGFRAVVVLNVGRDALRIASATWEKTPFDSWWRDASSSFSPVVPPLDGPIAAVTPAAVQACVSGPTWVPTPTWGVPSPRYLHTAVWTGAEMIVWGGQTDAQSLGTGVRYDPATDTWTAVATLAAPKDRAAHTAVWTGSKMIVWGGTANYALGDGGVYDPVSDSWQATTLTNAPTPRSYHSAVWTGSRMIVWGGQGGSGTGASYDPVANSWTAIATTGAPSDRSRHASAWTGSRMVVWGGRSPVGAPLDTGGVYDPAGDSWTPTAMAGAPSARWGQSGSWSGSELWIWGGTPDGTTVLGDGARYDAAGDSWTAMSGAGAPAARTDHRAVWAGTRLVVWGGSNGSSPLGDGGRYDASTESWLPLASAGAPAARQQHTAVWTGNRMLVFGGLDARAARTDGARYDPVGNVWSSMTGGVWAPSTRRSSVAVSTGVEFLVYGGETFDTSGPEWTATGAVYDSATDAWRPMTPPDATQVVPRETAAVWTGTEMIVWGGREPAGAEAAVDRGGRYNPALDVWTPVATSGAPAPRSLHTASWTGTEMIVWAGTGAAIFDSGGRYTPATNTWAPIASGGTARYAHTAVWTGSKIIAWGGLGVGSVGVSGPAAIYDPGTDSWSSSGNPLPGNDQPPIARVNHTAVWTGSRMIIWGGQKPNAATVKYKDGAAYDPAQDRWYATNLTGAPSARDKHVAIWDGGRMIVWGGTNSCCFLGDGAEYNPGANTWAPTSLTGAPAPRGQHVGAQLGTAAVLWGGLGTGSRTLNTGATYCGCVFYADVDGDGYGNPAVVLRDCSYDTPPPGYVRDARDCNDANPSVNPGASDASCDGIDQNCSGAADEGFVSGPSSCGVGACASTGVTSCVAGAIVDTCTPGTASAELCDGLDNDCNGAVDDGLGTIGCGVGACANTVPACVNGSPNACVPGTSSPEVCDGIDNDCDGSVDEGNPGGGVACGTGNLGVCSAGTTACTNGAIVCTQNVQPSAETCDGLDNDCNGVVDNGNPGGGVSCSTGQSGVCSAGTTACTGGAIACTPNTPPSAETCDGLDNDCNGVVDNGNPGGGLSCSTGLNGVCAAGTTACTNGAIACTQNTQPSAELCDGLDNNCDGIVDNVPLGVAALTAAKSGAAAQLTWTTLATATSYDVTRGVLSSLSSSGGDFTPSVDACVANDQAGTTVADAVPAPPDDGFWYLVRGNNCGGPGSYDEGVASQSGSRDAEIGASALACP